MAKIKVVTIIDEQADENSCTIRADDTETMTAIFDCSFDEGEEAKYILTFRWMDEDEFLNLPERD